MDVKKQFGVIPYIRSKNGGDQGKLIIITSRISGYWIFPKGNPMKKKDAFQVAEQEAWEEAGIRGVIEKKRAYTTEFKQNHCAYRLTLYPMEVKEILDQWPEMAERKRKIVSREKALTLITLSGFKSCLEQWLADTK